MGMKFAAIAATAWIAAALVAPGAHAQQSLLTDLDAADAACPPSAFSTMSALVQCQYGVERPIWFRHAPEVIHAYDDSVQKRLLNAGDFDARRITGEQTVERFKQIQLEFVVAAKEAQIAKLRQNLRAEERREQTRRVIAAGANALKTYNQTQQQAAPAPPIVSNCVTTGAFTNCTSY